MTWSHLKYITYILMLSISDKLCFQVALLCSCTLYSYTNLYTLYFHIYIILYLLIIHILYTNMHYITYTSTILCKVHIAFKLHFFALVYYTHRLYILYIGYVMLHVLCTYIIFTYIIFTYTQFTYELYYYVHINYIIPSAYCFQVVLFGSCKLYS